MLNIIDSHSHLDAPEFDPDRAAVIARARAAGVRAQILPAIDQRSWPRLKSLCATTPGLLPAYGLHPLLLADHRDAHLVELADWLRDEAPVAVGECGLDFYVEDLDRARQQAVFEAQLALARQFDLPVIIHARRAVEAVILTLRRFAPLTGVVHSFPGSIEQARELEKLGFRLGIGGPLTYPRARKLREVVVTVPLEQLLVETDAPDQPLCGHQGQRNEPARCVEVVELIARLRGLPVAQVAEQLVANALALFGPRVVQALSR